MLQHGEFGPCRGGPRKKSVMPSTCKVRHATHQADHHDFVRSCGVETTPPSPTTARPKCRVTLLVSPVHGLPVRSGASADEFTT